MIIHCPACAKTLKFAAALAGKRVRCSCCGNVFGAPEQPRNGQDEEPPPEQAPRRRARVSDDEVEEDEASGEGRRSPESFETKSRGNLLAWGVLLGGGVMCIAAALLVVLVVVQREAEPPAQAKASVPPPAPPQPKTAPWEPDPALLSQLDADVPLRGVREVSFRPPAGYKHETMGVEGQSLDAWIGPPWPDRTSPALMVVTAHGPTGDAHIQSPERQMDQLFRGMKAGGPSPFQNLGRSSTESQLVHGLQLARARLHGSSKTLGDAEGFLYMTKVDETTVVFFTILRESHQDTLRLLETSVLTVRGP